MSKRSTVSSNSDAAINILSKLGIVANHVKKATIVIEVDEPIMVQVEHYATYDSGDPMIDRFNLVHADEDEDGADSDS